MNEIYHIPAMLNETIEGLAIKPEGTYVDVTFGGGGHSCAIRKALMKGGRLFSFDQDIEAYENAMHVASWQEAQEEGQWTFVHANFRYLRNWMNYYGVESVDGILADLGVSFHHFDCPQRGFSFRFSAPLDMRMNQTSKRTAAEIVNRYSEEELAQLFWLYGEVKNGRGIAKAIGKARSAQPIVRTEDLVRIITPIVEMKDGEIEVAANAKKELARVFQALRIEVNDELGALREMLVAARDLLIPGGRIAILTYHSLEDRLVKNFMRSGNLEGTIEKDFYGNNLSPFVVIEKGREAGEEEVAINPRSRSAKLRVAQKK